MPRRTSHHIKYSWMDVAFPYFLNAFVHNRYNLHHAPFFAFLLRDYLSMNSCHNHSCSAYSMPCIVRWTPRVLTINPMSWFLCVCQFWFNFGTDPMRPRKLSGRIRCKHRYRYVLVGRRVRHGPSSTRSSIIYSRSTSRYLHLEEGIRSRKEKRT